MLGVLGVLRLVQERQEVPSVHVHLRGAETLRRPCLESPRQLVDIRLLQPTYYLLVRRVQWVWWWVLWVERLQLVLLEILCEKALPAGVFRGLRQTQEPGGGGLW